MKRTALLVMAMGLSLTACGSSQPVTPVACIDALNAADSGYQITRKMVTAMGETAKGNLSAQVTYDSLKPALNDALREYKSKSQMCRQS